MKTLVFLAFLSLPAFAQSIFKVEVSEDILTGGVTAAEAMQSKADSICVAHGNNGAEQVTPTATKLFPYSYPTEVRVSAKFICY